MNHYSEMAAKRRNSEFNVLSDQAHVADLQIKKKKLSLPPIDSELVREETVDPQFTQFQIQIEKDNQRLKQMLMGQKESQQSSQPNTGNNIHKSIEAHVNPV